LDGLELESEDSSRIISDSYSLQIVFLYVDCLIRAFRHECRQATKLSQCNRLICEFASYVQL